MESQSPEKERTSTSTRNSNSLSQSGFESTQIATQILKINSQSLSPTPSTASSELSSRLNRRAIKWLVTVCWTNDYNSEVLWTAIYIFYAYKARRAVSKQEITVLLSAALLLASKFSGSKLDRTQLIELIPRKKIDDVIIMETDILQQLDFNIWIPESICDQLAVLPESCRAQFELLVEILLLEDAEPFLNPFLQSELCSFAKGQQQFSEVLLSAGQHREAEIIVQKFNSKFNATLFLAQVNKS